MSGRKRSPRDKSAENVTPENGAFAYEGLDRVLHEKARLGILTALITRPDGIGFVDLKRACALTDGNLARHLQTLQEARFVDVQKLAADRGQRPATQVRLTPRGRRQFVTYLGELERVIRDAKGRDEVESDGSSSPRRRDKGADGLAPA